MEVEAASVSVDRAPREEEDEAHHNNLSQLVVVVADEVAEGEEVVDSSSLPVRHFSLVRLPSAVILVQ